MKAFTTKTEASWGRRNSASRLQHKNPAWVSSLLACPVDLAIKMATSICEFLPVLLQTHPPNHQSQFPKINLHLSLYTHTHTHTHTLTYTLSGLLLWRTLTSTLANKDKVNHAAQFRGGVISSCSLHSLKSDTLSPGPKSIHLPDFHSLYVSQLKVTGFSKFSFLIYVRSKLLFPLAFRPLIFFHFLKTSSLNP